MAKPLRSLLRDAAGPYLVVQGGGTIVWWIALLASMRVRHWFMEPVGWDAARTLLLADIAVFGLGSITTGLLLLRRAGGRDSVWVGRLPWAMVGAGWYATLVAVMWVMEPVHKPLGAVIMVPAAVLTTIFAFAAEGRE